MAGKPDKDTLEGGCLCGAVSLSIDQARRGIEVCHCDMCRRWSGGPFFSLHGVKEDALSVTGTEHVATFKSSEWAERAFCARCGSNLWFHFIPGGTRAVMAGLFSLPDKYAVSEQIFVDERPEWAKLAADTDEKTGAEIIAEAKAAGFDFG